MVYSLAVLGIIVYLLNHKKNSIKRLPVLIGLTVASYIVFTIFFKKFNLYSKMTFYDFCSYLVIGCAIDNLIFFYQNKNKEKENKVK